MLDELVKPQSFRASILISFAVWDCMRALELMKKRILMMCLGW